MVRIGLQSVDNLMGRNPRAAPWLHLLWATAFIVGVEFVASSGASPWFGSVAGMAGLLYGALPIAAAVSVAFIQIDGGFRRQVMLLGLTATAAMLFLDLVAPTALIQTGERVAIIDSRTVSSPMYSSLTTVSATQALAAVAGGVDGTEERLAEYPPDHPRLVTARALSKFGLMALPLILVAILGSAVLWVHREIPRPASARSASFVVGWFAGPGVYWLAFSWSHRAQTSVLIGDGAMPMVLAPYIPLALLAWASWNAVPRRSHEPSVPVESL